MAPSEFWNVDFPALCGDLAGEMNKTFLESCDLEKWIDWGEKSPPYGGETIERLGEQIRICGSDPDLK